ncbi:MAG: hypothetical protein MUF78_03660 [Candidatus Edwardsbacteria bacterium]|jgi:hypothetical protein|nr:hypothetical protein [Candidatus Edwardsbacteria bacterium]
MSCLTWPFVALWKLLAGIIRLTGRLLAVVVGFVLMVAGTALCFTIVGLVAGIPLAIAGALLMVRGLF